MIDYFVFIYNHCPSGPSSGFSLLNLVIPVTQTDDISASADRTNAHQSATDGVLYFASLAVAQSVLHGDKKKAKRQGILVSSMLDIEARRDK